MFSSKFTAVALALTLAFHLPSAVIATIPTCSTGSIQCCEQTLSSSSPAAAKILGPLGIVLQDLTGLIGVTCSPIATIVAGSDCTTSLVCCTNNNFNGVVALGCTPISIDL